MLKMVDGTPRERIVALRLLDPLEEMLQTPLQERVMRTVTNEGTFFPRYMRDNRGIAFTEDVWASLAMREYLTTRDGAWREWAAYYRGITDNLVKQEWLSRVFRYLDKAWPIQGNDATLHDPAAVGTRLILYESPSWERDSTYRMFEAYGYSLLDADNTGATGSLREPVRSGLGGGNTVNVNDITIDDLDRLEFD